jgi:serine/threonine-protein kinase
VALLKLPVRPPRDPAARQKLDQARQGVARADALAAAGKYEEAIRVAREAASAAAAVGYGPVEAEARSLIADRLFDLGRHKEGEAEQIHAAATAVEGHDDFRAAHVWCTLSVNLADDGRLAEAAQWDELGNAAAARIGSDSATRLCTYTHARLLRAQGKISEAIALQERQLATLEKRGTTDAVPLATTLAELGALDSQIGRFEESLACFRRSLAIFERVNGPTHPLVAQEIGNVAAALHFLGRNEEALVETRRAVAIFEQSLPESAGLANCLDNAGSLLQLLGRPAESLPYHRRALDLLMRRLGPTHPHVAITLSNIADALALEGHYDEALATYRRSLAITQPLLGNEHPDLALPLDGLGRALRKLSRYDEALAQFRRELAILEKTVPATHPSLAPPLDGIGDVLVAQHAAASAIAPLERALALREKDPGSRDGLPETRLLLARALWDAGRDRARARQLAEAARDGASQTQKREIEAWLRSHDVASR